MNGSSGTVELRAGHARVTIDLHAGGRIAQLEVGEHRLLRSGPGPQIGWGSYPMAPWAGRLRHGRFRFEGIAHQVPLNHTDDDGSRHAIHGTVFDATWTLDRSDRTAAELHCALGPDRWPLGGTARQSIRLTDVSVRCELSVESDTEPFPAAIGWHPWFRKPAHLTFTPTAMYRRDGIGLPAADLVEPVPGPWDDTFVNSDPVELHYPGRSGAETVTVSSDCDHWVVFDQPPDATCVEPQSGPPDALTMQPRRVDPATPLRRWMEIAWR